MIKHVAVPALMLAALCFTSTPAWSHKGHKGKDEKCDAAELVKDAKVTIDQAIKRGRDGVRGTAVEEELEKKHDKTVWEVEVLGADGKMTEVHIDFTAETAAAISLNWSATSRSSSSAVRAMRARTGNTTIEALADGLLGLELVALKVRLTSRQGLDPRK